MSTCTACLRRTFHSLTDRTPSSAGGNVFLYTPYLRLRRTHATLATLKRGHHRRLAVKVLNKTGIPPASKRRKSPLALSKPERKDALAREANRSHLDRQVETEAVEGEDVPPSQLAEATKQDVNLAVKAAATSEAEKRIHLRALNKARREVEGYYKDPLRLAQATLQRLRVPDIEGALLLVRASEGLGIENIVSWNHCMDWLMSQGETAKALKIYNEMKKRGHRPDAHTYTIMLRGFSAHVRQPNAVTNAVNVYNSMFAPNSAVKPNTIHTNAVINVCARGGNMDALWAVTGKLPEYGAGCPDKWTFTTILNAIRENTLKEAARSVDRVKFKGDIDEAEESRKVLFEGAVKDGRKLWEDVSYRWRRADLSIDESLVCAMGRLLLGCGVGKDIDQIFDLVDATMNLKVAERKNVNGEVFGKLAASKSTEIESAADYGSEKPAAEMSKLPLQENNVYATPSNNTLSMIMEAALLSKSHQYLAKSYWNLLTDLKGPYAIAPDTQNIMAYLRVLRKNRSSRLAYDILAQQWPDNVAQSLYKRGTFVLAMSTCYRDKNNPNVFSTAQALLKLMEERLEEVALGAFDSASEIEAKTGLEHFKARKEARRKLVAEMAGEDDEEIQRRKEGVEALTVDPKALRMFLELAVATTPGWNEGIRGRDDGEVFQRDPKRNHTMIALNKIGADTTTVRRLLKLKIEETEFDDMPVSKSKRKQQIWDNRMGSRVGEKLDDLLDLVRALISSYDKVIMLAERFEETNKPRIDAKVIDQYTELKKRLSSYMGKVQRDVDKKMRRHTDLDNDIDSTVSPEEDTDQQEPEMENKLKSVYNSVNEEYLSSQHNRRFMADKKRGFMNLPSSSNSDLRISSRRQRKGRENMITEKMQRQFGSNTTTDIDDHGLNSYTTHKRPDKPTGKKPSILANQTIQRGWGTGYEKMAREQQAGLDKDTNLGFVDVTSPFRPY